MKAKLKSTGAVIEVEPSVYKGITISYSERRKDGSLHIYLPKELELDNAGTDASVDAGDAVRGADEYWRNVEVQAAIHTLSACIIAGKKDAVSSAVYYAKRLVEELKTQTDAKLNHR